MDRNWTGKSPYPNQGGKTMSEQTALQDLLVHAVKGVGYWADMSRAVGGKDEEIDGFVFKALSAANAGPDEAAALVAKAVELKQKAKTLFEKHNGRAFSGFVPAAAKPFDLPGDRAGQVALGEQFGGKDPRVRPEILAVRQDIIKALRGIAASVKGTGTEAVCAGTQQALGSLVNDKMDKEEYEAVLKSVAGLAK
jgi:hydroxylamine reductase